MLNSLIAFSPEGEETIFNQRVVTHLVIRGLFSRSLSYFQFPTTN